METNSSPFLLHFRYFVDILLILTTTIWGKYSRKADQEKWLLNWDRKNTNSMMWAPCFKHCQLSGSFWLLSIFNLILSFLCQSLVMTNSISGIEILLYISLHCTQDCRLPANEQTTALPIHTWIRHLEVDPGYFISITFQTQFWVSWPNWCLWWRCIFTVVEITESQYSVVINTANVDIKWPGISSWLFNFLPVWTLSSHTTFHVSVSSFVKWEYQEYMCLELR